MRGAGLKLHLSLVAGILALGYSLPASASQAAFEKAWTTCRDQHAAAAARIETCGAVIESGQFKGGQRAQALTNRGIVRAQQKNFAGAIADLTAALQDVPDS